MFNFNNRQLQSLYQSNNYPVYECLINPNWKKLGHARIKYMENLGERRRNAPKIDMEKIKKELGVKY